MIALLEKTALGELRPDLTVVLDLPASEGLARAAQRRSPAEPADRFERQELAKHEALRAAFLDIAEREPGRCCVVDTAAPPDEVAQGIWRLVEARFLDAAA